MKNEEKKDIPKFYFTNNFLKFHQLFQDNSIARKVFKKGSILLSENNGGDSCVYIEKGWCQYSVIHDSGREKNLFLFGPHTLFPTYTSPKRYHIGEIGTAITDVEGLVLTQKRLNALMDGDHRLTKSVMDNYLEMFNYLIFDSINSSYNNAHIRVCNFLELFSNYLRETDGQTIQMSQEDLAKVVGVSRVQVSHIIAELRRQGIIETGRNQITILNEEKLREYCTGEIIP